MTVLEVLVLFMAIPPKTQAHAAGAPHPLLATGVPWQPVYRCFRALSAVAYSRTRPPPTRAAHEGQQNFLSASIARKFMSAKSAQPIADGCHAITPYMMVKDAQRFIDFMPKTFDAQTTEQRMRPDGKIGHTEIRVADSVLMLSEAVEPQEPTPVMLLLLRTGCRRGIRARAACRRHRGDPPISSMEIAPAASRNPPVTPSGSPPTSRRCRRRS
jgi:hypothetical protein